MAERGLGVGLVWWPGLDPLCSPAEGLIDVVEAEPEAFWRPGLRGAFHSQLPAALAHLPQPKLLHGVGAVLGGACPPPRGHAQAFLGEIEALAPDFVSEHLSVTHFRPGADAPPTFAGFMLPPRQTSAGVDLIAANIRARRAALGGVALAVETPVSYLPPAPDEIDDGAFLAAVAERADCGLLLDLHNVLANQRNGRQPVQRLCAALPLERVWELHLAGGETLDGFYLDAHSGLADAELMALATELAPRLPSLRAIVLEILPERVEATGLGAIARQIGEIRDLWGRRGRGVAPATRSVAARAAAPALLDPAGWERLLGAALGDAPEPPPAVLADWWRAATPAIALYRRLAGEARASAVASGAPAATRALLTSRGGPATRRLLADYWRGAAPGYMVIDEARGFLRYLADRESADAGLAEAVAADAARLGGL